MRKFTFYSLLVLLFAKTSISAQLFVGQNSYVYVNKQYVTVTKDVSLQKHPSDDTKGNIYLRDQGQLLQKSGSPTANSGDGKVSVFQEGTVNNFQYNYWCSPVGAATSTGNRDFSISLLNRPTTPILSTAASILPAPALDGFTTPTSLSIPERWIFTYVNSTQYSQWVPTRSGSIAPGLGFTMKGSATTAFGGAPDTTVAVPTEDLDASIPGIQVFSNNPGFRQRYDFRGRPNNGDITINTSPGQMTLTGNPYPSAIDLKKFLYNDPSDLTDNPSAGNCTGIAYFWEQDKSVNSHLITAYRGGYGYYAAGIDDYTEAAYFAYDGAGQQIAGTTGTGGSYARRFCPIGQGFMIEGAAGTSMTMSNNYRVYQKEDSVLSHFEKTNATANDTDDASGFLPAIPSVSGYDYTTVSTAHVPVIRFNTLLNNEGVRKVTLAFHPLATDGVDRGMDAKSADAATTDMYFVLDNKEYIVETVQFDINKRIPIGFKNAVPAQFKIAVGEIINFDGAEHIYIHDKETDLYHDIKNAEYEMSLPAGVNNNRYEITFINNALAIPNLTAESFEVLQNNVSQMLTVANPKMMDIKSVSMYDIGGKLIFNKTQLGPKVQYQFSTAGISDAVYVVKIITADNQDFGKKITVYNSK